jgi:selenocysteine-specific elongation factor
VLRHSQVTLTNGEVGVIESSFGQSGKVKVYVAGGLCDETVQQLQQRAKGKQQSNDNAETTTGQKQQQLRVTLTFKRYMFDVQKKMHQ